MTRPVEEAAYICPACGETIVVPVEALTGEQEYVEDCPVCCNPVVLRLRAAEDGEITIEARTE